MEEADKDWMMIRMVGGWMFLLVLVHPGSPGQRAIKRLLARLQTWRAIIFSQVCLSVCLCVYVSLTSTSTLQRWPILMKLGHKDPTVI